MPRLGVVFLGAGFLGLTASVAAGLYLSFTSYGAYAIKMFFGEEWVLSIHVSKF